VTGRQKSDGRVVPEERRKAYRADASQQGKAATVSKQSGQLGLFGETAANPQGATAARTSGPPDGKRTGVPKSSKGKSNVLAPMTMEEIAHASNLKMAFSKVATNRGAPGPDRRTIEQVRENLSECLSRLQRSLLDGSYRVGDIRRVWIPKAGGGQRGLGIPNVVDRVVQQAVHQVLSPHYEQAFHDWSHGFRPGRSCHTAIKQAQEHLQTGLEWVVDIDLAKFFDEVNHDRLMSRLEQRIADRRVLSLIRQMLRAKVVLPDGVIVATERGTPQGGPLSPLMSNIVLDELDHELAERGHRFVRYADDCNIYVRSERAGQRVMASLTTFIEKRLKLKVNSDKSKVARPHERSFLSLKLHRLKTGTVRVLVADKALQKVEAELKTLTPRNWGQSLDDCIQRVNVLLRGWLGYFAICDEKHVARLGRIDGHLRRRLRALLLKQWKRKGHIVNRLSQMGVPNRLARVDVYARRRGWWALSKVRAVSRGLTNKYFERRGLFALQAHWQKHHERIWDIGPKQLALQVGTLK
jgi:RNA-directed DNA polymerase